MDAFVVLTLKTLILKKYIKMHELKLNPQNDQFLSILLIFFRVF